MTSDPDLGCNRFRPRVLLEPRRSLVHQAVVRPQADLGQLARLVGSCANRGPCALFAAVGADPCRSEEWSALINTDVVANSVDVHLFQAFPSCIEKSHDRFQKLEQARHFGRFRPFMFSSVSKVKGEARPVPGRN
jgi:hypothetical protein